MTVEIIVESFGQFLQKSKKSKIDYFLAIFGLTLVMLFTSQQCKRDEITHKRP